ncbi:MAG TPA: hypothetical protein VMR41_05950 [Patescibacteria group bacterium]|nr:hypothetical protein [Patescibacteria group bacterium]
MYDNINIAFISLINQPAFQELVSDYRVRFGIPNGGFKDSASEQYKKWITEGLRKSDHLKEQFIFIAKRCKNLIPTIDPIPNVLLAYYFLYGKIPSKLSDQNDFNFSIETSGVLGSFDIIFRVPLIFGLDNFTKEIEKHEDEIEKLAIDSKSVVTLLSSKNSSGKTSFNPSYDILATTPGNGADVIDRVHRDIIYLAEFGRIVLREHLQNMKKEDFIVNNYEDKNKPLFSPIQQMGMFLLNRGLFPIVEEYWKHIDDEIQNFNQQTGKRVNRGIPLANIGVSQIAQGKVIEGLFNIYRGYADDQECLKHLSTITIDPEKDMANSILFTQFEEKQIDQLFKIIVTTHHSVFSAAISKQDLSTFILNLNSDKKLLFYITLYRFSFALSLNNKLTTIISRSEILRSLAEFALWFEDELKRKNVSLSGQTLIQILDQKVGKLNPVSGKYTKADSLNELSIKITAALAVSSTLEIKNARVMGCIRNFAGHNIELQDHVFFHSCDEIFARMLSFIMYAKTQGWI